MGTVVFVLAKFEGLSLSIEKGRLTDFVPMQNGVWFIFRSLINQASDLTDTRYLNALR